MKAVSEQMKSEDFHPPGRNKNAHSHPHHQLPTNNQPSASSQTPPSSRPKNRKSILVVGTSLLNKLNKQVIKNVTDSNVNIVKNLTIVRKDGKVKPELNHTDTVTSE